MCCERGVVCASECFYCNLSKAYKMFLFKIVKSSITSHKEILGGYGIYFGVFSITACIVLQG